jgi:hypothetical protein
MYDLVDLLSTLPATIVISNWVRRWGAGLVTQAFCMRTALHLLARLAGRAAQAGVTRLHHVIRTICHAVAHRSSKFMPGWCYQLLAQWLGPLVCGVLLMHAKLCLSAAPFVVSIYAACVSAAMPSRMHEFSILPLKLSCATFAAAFTSSLMLLTFQWQSAFALDSVMLLVRLTLAGVCCQLYLVLCYACRQQQVCSWVLLKLVLLCCTYPNWQWCWRLVMLTEKLRLLTYLRFHAPMFHNLGGRQTCLLLQRLSRLLLFACLLLVPPGELQSASFVPTGCIAAARCLLALLAAGCVAAWAMSSLLDARTLEPSSKEQRADGCCWQWVTSASVVTVLAVPTLLAHDSPVQQVVQRCIAAGMRGVSLVDCSLAAAATVWGIR